MSSNPPGGKFNDPVTLGPSADEPPGLYTFECSHDRASYVDKYEVDRHEHKASVNRPALWKQHSLATQVAPAHQANQSVVERISDSNRAEVDSSDQVSPYTHCTAIGPRMIIMIAGTMKSIIGISIF